MLKNQLEEILITNPYLAGYDFKISYRKCVYLKVMYLSKVR